MARIKDIYGIISASREKIINTMLERGLTEVTIVPDEEDYNKEHENDPDFCDTDWSDYKSENAPYVTYINKWGAGYQYEVLKVHLVKGEFQYRFKLEAEENEVGYDTFYDSDCTYLSMANVYDKLEELLGIEDDPEKIYLVKQESNVDGELHFNVVPCKDMETAKRVLAEEVNTLLAESPKYKDAKRWIDGGEDLNMDDCPYSWENDKDDAFYISCTCDDYHELITIEEKEVA